MINLTFLAEIIFFGSYFIAWVSKEIPHTTWLNVSAISAIVIVILLVLYNGYPYLNKNNPNA